MSVERPGRKAFSFGVGGGMFLAMVGSSIVGELLAGQTLWLRVMATGITAGILAGGFVLLVCRLKRV